MSAVLPLTFDPWTNIAILVAHNLDCCRFDSERGCDRIADLSAGTVLSGK